MKREIKLKMFTVVWRDEVKDFYGVPKEDNE